MIEVNIKWRKKTEFLLNQLLGLIGGVKPIIHQSELRTYTKVVPFKENSSFRFVVL